MADNASGDCQAVQTDADIMTGIDVGLAREIFAASHCCMCAAKHAVDTMKATRHATARLRAECSEETIKGAKNQRLP